MKEKVDAACRMLNAQGHSVEPQIRGAEGRMWFQVDRRMLVSREEMLDLADGVYTLPELEELYRRRQTDGAAQQ